MKTKPCEFLFHYKLYKLLCRNASFQIGEAYGVLFVFPFLLEFISWSDGRFQPASQRSSCQKKPLAITSASMKCFNFGKTQCFSKKTLNQKYSGQLYIYGSFHWHYRKKKNTFCSCHYPSHERSPFAGWPRGPAPLGCRPQNLYLLQKRAVRKLLSPKSAYPRRISPVDLDFILLFSTLHSSLSYYCFLLLPLHLRNTYNREKDFFFPSFDKPDWAFHFLLCLLIQWS